MIGIQRKAKTEKHMHTPNNPYITKCMKIIKVWTTQAPNLTAVLELGNHKNKVSPVMSSNPPIYKKKRANTSHFNQLNTTENKLRHVGIPDPDLGQRHTNVVGLSRSKGPSTPPPLLDKHVDHHPFS